MHFRILKIMATSGFLTALECTKFFFDRCSVPGPGPRWGSLQRSPAPSWFKEALLLRRREAWKERLETEREGRVVRGKEGNEQTAF